MSKLPSWSESWKILADDSMMTTEAMKAAVSNISRLDDSFIERDERMRAANNRMLKFIKTVDSMDPTHARTESEDPSDSQEGNFSILELFDHSHALLKGEIDSRFKFQDEITTGGLIYALTAEEEAHRRMRAFLGLVSLDWSKGIPRQGEETTSSLSSSYELAFLDKVVRRQQYVTLHLLLKDALQVHTMSYSSDLESEDSREAVNFVESAFPYTDDHQGSEEWEKFKSSLQQGIRWNEVQRVLDADEILLYTGWRNIFCNGTALQTLDISTIIEDGTDSEFRQLKQNLQLPALAWLKETCLQLQGILPLVLRAYTLRESDWNASLKLAQVVQNRLAAVFGHHDFIEQNFDKAAFRCAEGDLFLYLIDVVDDEEQCHNEPLRSRFLDGTQDALAIVMAELREANPQRGLHDTRMQLTRQYLREVVRLLLQEEKENLGDRVCKEAFEKVRFRLLEGVESFILASRLLHFTPETPNGRLLSEQDRQDYQKYRDRASEAFRAAFAIEY